MNSSYSTLEWLPAWPDRSTAAHGVNLFLVDLDIFQPPSLQALSQAELQRAARFHFAEDRKHFLAARVALREILGQQLGARPDTIEFTANLHGKPALAGIYAGALHFNLSHSGGHLLLAISAADELGVDLEEIRSELEMEPLAEHYFTPEERWRFRTARGADRVWAFFETWTAIEARLKAEGCGLTDELPAEAAHGWHTTPMRIAGRFAATLATRNPQPFMHTWTWPK